MSEQGLPVLNGPIDHLRQGFLSYQHQYGQHPVQMIENNERIQWNNKLDVIRRTYGSHMAMRLATERKIHSTNRRLPGLQSSHLGLDVLSGDLTQMEFQDYLKGM